MTTVGPRLYNPSTAFPKTYNVSPEELENVLGRNMETGGIAQKSGSSSMRSGRVSKTSSRARGKQVSAKDMLVS